MPLKFSTNIALMFTEERHLADRYKAAKEAGFCAVEIGNPGLYESNLDELVQKAKDSGIQHTLTNTPTGERENDWGVAALPGRTEDFKKDLELAIKYAKALQCPRVHVLSGRKPEQWFDLAMDEVYIENIKYAAQRFQQEDLTVLLEAIDPRVIRNYYLDSIEQALEVIKKVNMPNVKLLLDIFHLQRLNGDLTEKIKCLLPYSGYIQVAQVPNRSELSHEGEIDFKYVLNLLDQLGYDGWIGLEYSPTGTTMDSLKWMKEWGWKN